MEASFEEAVNYAHAYDDGGNMILLFEMSLTHDCTTFLFDAAARPSPPSPSFLGELRSPCLRRLVFVQPWRAAVVTLVHC